MKTNLQVIDEALALIQREDGWCQGAYCADSIGPVVPTSAASPTGWQRSTGINSPGPTRFCLEGAIRYANGSLGKLRSIDLLPQAIYLEELIVREGLNQSYPDLDQPYYYHARDFNDAADTTQEDAVQVLKRVRTYLEENPDDQQ